MNVGLKTFRSTLSEAGGHRGRVFPEGRLEPEGRDEVGGEGGVLQNRGKNPRRSVVNSGFEIRHNCKNDLFCRKLWYFLPKQLLDS